MDELAPLARQPGEAAEDWGLRLLDDMTDRHRRSAGVALERYLREVPGLVGEREVVLDLFVAEWTLRGDRGEVVTLTEYARRFPEWGQELHMLWDADRQALDKVEEPAPGTRLPDWYVGAAPLPAEFAGYRLVRELGGGGMARVFLAEPLAGGEEVALKVPGLPPGHDADAAEERAMLRRRFLREARISRELGHSRLCRALDAAEECGLPYFTMPYYPRGSLGEELRARGPLAEHDAARLIAGAARALQHAHDHGVLHRDLKPSNLLLDERGEAVVTDFGLALQLDGDGSCLTRTGNIPGTPLYLSPEQAGGRAELTPASDVFSLGVVLYELLASQRPFAGQGVNLLRAIQEASPPALEQLRPGVSPALAAVCRRAMAREPGDRYPSMAGFAEDLERFLAGTWEKATDRRAVPRRRGRRLWAAGLGAAGALVLGAFALNALLRSDGESPARPGGEDVSPSPPPRAMVSKRTPVGLRGQLQAMHDDLDKLDASVRPHVRYLSLMAVHDNPYVSDSDLNLHAVALRRVLARLGNSPRRDVPVHPVDASLLRIDLRDLAWHPDIEWWAVLRAEPYGMRYDAHYLEESLRRLALDTYTLAGVKSLSDTPSVRGDWFIVAATRAPLFDVLQRLDGTARGTPAFDLTAADDPVARVVQLYMADIPGARAALAELGLGTGAVGDAPWPLDRPELREALDHPLSRRRWAGDDGDAQFSDYVRALKLGVPRAAQPPP